MKINAFSATGLLSVFFRKSVHRFRGTAFLYCADAEGNAENAHREGGKFVG